jgi:arsenate reductase
MVRNVLFLCTGNSARSILAEALMNELGAPHFRGYSAGSTPKGAVNPYALRLLQARGHDVDAFRSKSWDEFATPDAPAQDFIITVCDNAAGEVCPVWPGRPATAHWGQPDPAAVEGAPEDIAAAFEDASCILEARIRAFLSLPFDDLGAEELRDRLRDIGASALVGRAEA